MLENELDEKHRMGEMCQRLKDEVRGMNIVLWMPPIIILVGTVIMRAGPVNMLASEQ